MTLDKIMHTLRQWKFDQYCKELGFKNRVFYQYVEYRKLENINLINFRILGSNFKTQVKELITQKHESDLTRGIKPNMKTHNLIIFDNLDNIHTHIYIAFQRYGALKWILKYLNYFNCHYKPTRVIITQKWQPSLSPNKKTTKIHTLCYPHNWNSSGSIQNKVTKIF